MWISKRCFSSFLVFQLYLQVIVQFRFQSWCAFFHFWPAVWLLQSRLRPFLYSYFSFHQAHVKKVLQNVLRRMYFSNTIDFAFDSMTSYKTEFEANQSPQGRQAWQTFEAQRSGRSPAPGEESYLSARRQQRQRAEIYPVRWACSLRSRRQVDRHAVVFCSYFSTTRRFEFHYQINWNQVCHVISVSNCRLLSLSLTVCMARKFCEVPFLNGYEHRLEWPMKNVYWCTHEFFLVQILYDKIFWSKNQM